MQSIEDKIVHYIEETFFVKFGVDVDKHTNLFTEGIIDSLGFVNLISFIEDEFKTKLSKEVIDSNSFATLAGISGAVTLVAEGV